MLRQLGKIQRSAQVRFSVRNKMFRQLLIELLIGFVGRGFNRDIEMATKGL